MPSESAVPEVLTRRQVVRWWELRRPLFNLSLMVVGFASIAVMEWLLPTLLPEGDQVVEPTSLVLVVIVYGVLVNLCYTLGWVTELCERKSNQMVARERAQLLFRVMLAFSLILATGPLVYACAYWLFDRVER